MPTYYPLTPFPPQFHNPTTNELISGGTLEAFVNPGSTPTNMFSDENGTSVGSTVSLNSGGYPESAGATIVIWAQNNVDYKFVLKDSEGSTIWTANNISGRVSSDEIIDENSGDPLTTAIADGGPPDFVYYSGPSKDVANSDHNTYIHVIPMVVTNIQIDTPSAGNTTITVASHGASVSDTIQLTGPLTGISGISADTDYTVSAVTDTDNLVIAETTTGTFTNDGLTGLDIDRTFTFRASSLTRTGGVEVNFYVTGNISRNITFAVADGAKFDYDSTSSKSMTGGARATFKQHANSSKVAQDIFDGLGCFA